MSGRVVIAQSDTKSVHILANLFTDRGDNPQSVNAPQELPPLLTQDRPALLVIDLHLVVNGWQNTLQQISKQFPETKILFTSSFPDPLLETQIKERYQNPIILRQPFTRTELEQILQTFTTPPAPQRSSQATTKPKVRIPVRIKITLPYILLALILAMAAAYVVSQVVLDTIEERFTNQLIEAGKLTNDWMVQEEDRLLETLRLVAHTRGLPAALVEADAEELRQQVLPVAINYQEEAVHLLDMQGTSVLSLHHRQGANLEAYDASRGDTIFSRWDFVQPVLNQESSGGLDKYAGLARAPWGHYLYVTGPIVDDQGQQVGVVL
ncbi:MAG: hypothetical protein AMJ56_18115, partial [Anaerolineae bacterium SG8_19]